MKQLATAAAALCLVLMPQAASADPADFSGDDWMRMMVGEQIYGKIDLERGRNLVWDFYVRADVDGDGVSMSDRKLKIAQYHATARGRRLTVWFENDLNANGMFEHDELRAIIRQELSKKTKLDAWMYFMKNYRVLGLEERFARYMRGDRDEDGALSYPEAQTIMVEEAEDLHQNNHDFQYPSTLPVVLDTNRDGTIEREEYDAHLTRAIAWADMNADGKLSLDERSAIAAEADTLRGKFHKWDMRCSEFCLNFL